MTRYLHRPARATYADQKCLSCNRKLPSGLLTLFCSPECRRRWLAETAGPVRTEPDVDDKEDRQ